MVRLKGYAIDSADQSPAQFQFHNGSIKSKLWHTVYREMHMFQFHNGSIKRGQAGKVIDKLIKFQFHNGSIKRI